VEDNDRNVGTVLHELERQKILDDTAIILSSDHGFFLGEHHLYDKRLMYEPSIRVPMMMRYPKRVAAGTTSAEMVLNLDIAPAMLDLAGAPVLPKMQGRDMMLLAEGKKNQAWREDWLYEYYEYPGFENVRPCRGVRTDRYKFIEFFIEPIEYELYDLQEDPQEMNNLYGKPGFAALTKQMQDRLARLRKETGDNYQYKPTGIPLHPGPISMSESQLKNRKM
jgi:arylsulfatase A-like enzyme